MPLSNIEIIKIEEIYNDKIKNIREIYNKFYNRKQTQINFISGIKLNRWTSAWRLEVKLGRKLNTSRVGGNETCDHIDGDKTNDFENNLRLLSNEDNVKNQWKINRNLLVGENHGCSKYTKDDIFKIKNDFFINHMKQIEIIKKYKIHQATLRDILNGITWKDVKIEEEKPLNKCEWNTQFKFDIKIINDIIYRKYILNQSVLLISKLTNIKKQSIFDILRKCKNNYKYKKINRPYFVTLYNKQYFLKENMIIIIDNIKYKFIGYYNKNNINNENIIYISDNNKIIRKKMI